MTNQQHLKLFKHVDSLPSLPATVSNVMAVTADPDSSADDLAKVILPDQSMCAAILKMANSAFFGVPRSVATLDKAVAVLGFNEVLNIVLGKAVYNSFKSINKQSKQTINAFWTHAFSCGLAAKIIAKDFRCSQGELFIAGLIHDIGKLAFFIAITDDYLPILQLDGNEQILCRQIEQDTFGIDHGQIGYRILTRWLFPECLLDAVGFHHSPEQSGSYTMHAIIVQLGDALSILAGMQNENTENELLPQLCSLLPQGEELWQSHNLDINEECLQKWMAAFHISFEQDNAILEIFAS